MMNRWGFMQGTPSMQLIASKGAKAVGKKRRAKRKKAKAAPKSKRRAAVAGAKRRSSKKRLVKGSAAARAYMAKIRKMRKK